MAYDGTVADRGCHFSLENVKPVVEPGRLNNKPCLCIRGLLDIAESNNKWLIPLSRDWMLS